MTSVFLSQEGRIILFHSCSFIFWPKHELNKMYPYSLVINSVAREKNEGVHTWVFHGTRKMGFFGGCEQ